MVLIFPTLIALAAGLAFIGIAIKALRLSRSKHFTPVSLGDSDADSRALIRSARLRMRWALIAAAAVALGILMVPIDPLGTSLMLAPGIGVVAGLAVICITPLGRRSRHAGVRQASLAPRRPASFGPTWGFVLPIVTASSLALMLLVTAATASDDSLGLSRSITVTSEGGSHGSGPYPGWFYAVPLLIVTVVIGAVTLLAVRRIASTPARSTTQAAVFEAAARRSLTKFTMVTATAVIVFYLGAVATVAGTAIRSASQWTVLEPEHTNDPSRSTTPPLADNVIHGVVQPQFAAASTEVLIGLVLIVFAIILLVLALEIAVRGPVRLSRATPEKHARVLK